MAVDATVIELTENDTDPLEIEVSDANGPVPLPAGTTVVFRADQREGTKLVIRNCTITTEGGNLVSVPFQAGDLDTPALYDAEVEVTFPNASRKTFPSKQLIRVRPELG